jgi:ADP-ribose pyrophosphatase
MQDPAEVPGSASLSRWETLASEPHADCRVFQVRRKTCRHPRRGSTGSFFVLDSVDWVNVVALTPAGELVMVTQFRFGTEDFSLEVPGGLIEPGEDPVIAGQRELLEETGFGGGTATLLARVRPNPAIQNNTCHLVFVDGVTRQSGHDWDEHEEIHVSVLPVEEVLARVHRGEIVHSMALNALFFFEVAWRRRGQGARGAV